MIRISKIKSANSGGASPRYGARACTVSLLVAVVSCSLVGCNNVDSRSVQDVEWSCPKLPVTGHLPKMKDQDGYVTYGYKLSTSVRFRFIRMPDQYVDLYQPGLCEFLRSQQATSLPMTFGLTKSREGKLLSYEEISLPGRDLSTAQQTRSTLYLASDRDTIQAMDKKTLQSKEYEFIDEEAVPAHRMTVEDLLPSSK